MYKQSIFCIALLLLNTSVHAAGQILTLQELCAQRVVREDVLDHVADVPQHFKDLGIDDTNNQVTPKVQQAFVDAIRKRFGQELSQATPVRTLTGHSGWVSSAAISPDGKYIVTGSFDKTAKVWDRQTGQLIHTLTDHSHIVFSVAVSSDGKYIVTGSGDTTAKVWNTETGQLMATLTGHSDGVNSVAISFDGKFMVTGSLDDTTKVWDMRYLCNTMNLKELLEYITDNFSQQSSMTSSAASNANQQQDSVTNSEELPERTTDNPNQYNH
jgi:WD40 repeat protein